MYVRTALYGALQGLLVLSVISLVPGAVAEEQRDVYSPYVGQTFPKNVYWGDTHVHSNLSADSYSFGNVELTPDVAYRFARGEEVQGSSGQPVKLNRPLDFLVVTDHAEFMGILPMLDAGDEKLLETELGRRWAAMFARDERQEVALEFIRSLSGDIGLTHEEHLKQYVWHQVTEMADRYNDPGRFTAFIGYEWTSMPDWRNLHRNMIFRDGADRANQIVPFSAMDSYDPEDLWEFLADYEEKTGGRVLAIPHNANVSNGLMFSDRTLSGDALTRSYAETRSRWEPVVEVTQIKGDGESNSYLSPDDPFADFENWDDEGMGLEAAPKEDWMYKYEYARSALRMGLQFEEELGANPFKFGMIGSSDAHTSLAAVEANNFFSKFGRDEPRKSRAGTRTFEHSESSENYVSSGYAAVWATKNTREALFDAMQRREVYATTGPRMIVRFFGGWDFDDQDHLRPDYVARGYESGVPMGGDLTRAPDGKPPRFLVLASKDPDGAHLDRVQIVKGWLGADGETHEKVYDAAVSDGREIDPVTGLAPMLRSTVDLDTATYTNTLGAPVLSTVWEDPDFDPNQRAFYYVRALEISTPRWSTYDAAFFGTGRPDNVPAELQQRAYTSPIWYTP